MRRRSTTFLAEDIKNSALLQRLTSTLIDRYLVPQMPTFPGHAATIGITPPQFSTVAIEGDKVVVVGTSCWGSQLFNFNVAFGVETSNRYSENNQCIIRTVSPSIT